MPAVDDHHYQPRDRGYDASWIFNRLLVLGDNTTMTCPTSIPPSYKADFSSVVHDPMSIPETLVWQCLVTTPKLPVKGSYLSKFLQRSNQQCQH
jgi:hypothetical protein